MYDCVYPTRTARFGVALIPGKSPGTLRLKGHECASAVDAVIQSDCLCQACRCKISRSRLHTLFKTNNPVAVELITQHNLVYMMTLVRNMRQAILEDRYGDFCIHFLLEQFPSKYGVDGLNVPTWVLDALNAAGIQF